MKETIFTIGHSTHRFEKFLELLDTVDVMAVCDVRSSPYSRMTPQFNREDLQKGLEQVGKSYHFLGKALGARPDDPSCYQNKQVQFEILKETSLFQDGIAKVLELGQHNHVALMCAEKEPLSCHRTILVARALIENGAYIEHILDDGSREQHDQTMARLLKQLHLADTDMFRSKDEILNDAYRLQESAIAYSLDRSYIKRT